LDLLIGQTSVQECLVFSHKRSPIVQRIPFRGPYSPYYVNQYTSNSLVLNKNPAFEERHHTSESNETPLLFTAQVNQSTKASGNRKDFYFFSNPYLIIILFITTPGITRWLESTHCPDFCTRMSRFSAQTISNRSANSLCRFLFSVPLRRNGDQSRQHGWKRS